MPYEFTEWEYEPETSTSSSRSGGPPSRLTAVGTLDPEYPDARPRRFAERLKAILAKIFLRGKKPQP